MPDAPSHTSTTATPTSAGAVLRGYLELAKPEISFLVVLSAMGGFLLGSPEAIDGWRLLVTLVGVGLTAGGAGALNHYLERELDARMRRTQDRVLPAGVLSPRAARTYGIALVVAGVALLCPLVNPLTAILAAATAALYLFVYTPLKRRTKYNTLVGTLPGALPALGGYTAATGHFGWPGWALFVILLAWQMPHFLSLAWMYRKDYARGGYRMLPVVEPDGDSTAAQMVGFTALLAVASLTPAVVTPSLGGLYLTGAVLLGGWFLVETARFYRFRTGRRARRVLMASIWYVPALIALIVLDWLV